MYQIVDRPVASLDPTRQVALRVMRSWVHAARADNPPLDAVSETFAAHGMVGALIPFSRLMQALDRKARLPLTFCHPDCPAITPDEAVLLTVLSDLARRDIAKARTSLTLLLGEDEAEAILLATIQWNEALRALALSAQRSGD